MVTFKVNGVQVSTDKTEDTLLHFLRNDLGLKSVKDGCSMGQCGTCTVIVNHKAVRSCTRKVKMLEGAEIETVEGIGSKEQLHPVQTAFLICHAFQCGFCTPGMIMAVKALLDENINPTDAEIKKALRNNYCRCTGYQQIIDAVHVASEILRGVRDNTVDNGNGWVGESPSSKHGEEKVMGLPIFTDDIVEADAYEGVFLFSKYPHAKIISIDTTLAERMPGLIRIFTSDNIPGNKYFNEDFIENEQGDKINLGQPILAIDKVCYIGEPVCLVIAKTEKQARDAAAQIVVEYKQLPVYSNTMEALQTDAIQIHEGLTNDYYHLSISKGDVQAAKDIADIVLQKDFETHQVDHGLLETSVAFSKIGVDGRLELYSSCQSLTSIQNCVCKALDIPKDHLHYVNKAIAGGFGGREGNICHIAAAMGAYLLKHAVRVSMTRDEMQAFAPKRHAIKFHYELSAMSDGTITGIKGRAEGDTGAYSNYGNFVMKCVTVMGAGPYNIPNIDLASMAVFTNNTVAGGFRGYGSTQTTAIVETMLDELACKLKIDGYTLRKKNAMKVGSQTPVGQVIEYSCGFNEALDAVMQAYLKDGKPTPSASSKKVGVGIAGGYKNQGVGKGTVDGSGAAIDITPNGRICVFGGGVDLGQGHDTVICQIAATRLRVPYDIIDVAWNDDDTTPYTTGSTSASRATYMSGNAVLGACRIFEQNVFSFVQEHFSLSDNWHLQFERNGVSASTENEDRLVTYQEIIDMANTLKVKLRADYYYADTKCVPIPNDGNNPTNSSDHNIYTTYMFSAQIAVVEVDTETGDVTVKKVYSASDLGRMINPQNVYGQIYGGIVQGMGLCLYEHWDLEEGYIKTKGYRALGIPNITQMPEIIPIAIEEGHPHGPYNAKGFSEGCLNTTTPAILNAIYDAVGVRINSIPVDKEYLRSQICTSNR